jgi:alanine-glyoxylate transaminase / serine-glyoxylate transaminase / serine-pyruvate transaminase
VEVLAGDWRRAVRPEEVEARLREDVRTAGANRFKAILVVQVDTASGAVNDIAAIGKAIKAAGHDALYMVDAVASLGCMPFAMDAWGVDVAMAGSQKGLMTPPGLSFVAAGARARAAHKRANLRTPYWDWTAREGKIHYQKYCGTAPEHLMFGLAQAFEMIRAEGLDNIFRRHRVLGEAVRRAVAMWARGKAFDFNIAAPAERSDTVTTIRMGEGRDARALLAYCNTKCGVVLGQGLGELSEKAFRIAHMGHVNAPMVLGTLGVIECALQALDIPHRKGGVEAAITWLAEQVEP